jgi:hypothetical protein
MAPTTRRYERREYASEIEHQPGPQQRLGDVVREQLRVQVDHGERDQAPAEQHRTQRNEAGTETNGGIGADSPPASSTTG